MAAKFRDALEKDKPDGAGDAYYDWLNDNWGEIESADIADALTDEMLIDAELQKFLDEREKKKTK